MFTELKKELIKVESEMEVSYCEPEQGPLLEKDDEAEKERPIESHKFCKEYISTYGGDDRKVK